MELILDTIGTFTSRRSSCTDSRTQTNDRRCRSCFQDITRFKKQYRSRRKTRVGGQVQVKVIIGLCLIRGLY